MNTSQALRSVMDISMLVLKQYVSDLSDAELMTRPGPACNHLAWQMGHLIASEVHLLNSICPGKGPELPPGFAEQHSKETTASNEAGKFCTKDQYLALFDKVNAATITALEGLTESQLDAPAPENFRSFCPTVGHMFTLIGSHPMMHAGQFAVVRRHLGKPVLM